MADLISAASLLGLAAGAIIAASSVPQIVANLRSPEAVLHQSPLRNGFLAIGNGLWVLCGILLGVWPIIVFCGVNALLNVALLIQWIRIRKRR